MAERLYLDDAAATRVRPEVAEAMAPFLAERFGNPASLHGEGVAARRAIEAARASIARGLEAHADELVFTSGGTEANNLALLGAAAAKGEGRVLVSNIEHPSVREPVRELSRRGFTVTEVAVDGDGLIDPRRFARALTSDTILASVIFAHNEIGTVQPIAELGKLAQRNGTLFHTDACQAAAWLPIRVEALHVDLLTLNAAKLGGPKGVGALYVSRGTELRPILFGGGQERGLRSGTENVPGIVGFAKAFDLVRARLGDVGRVQKVRDALTERLLALDGVTLNGHRTARLPNNVNVSIEGVDGETLVLGLDAAGIAASSGSACSALHENGSPTLTALGRPVGGNLRFAIGWDTSEEDVRRVVSAVTTLLDRQRPLEAAWPAAVRRGKEARVRGA